METEGFYKLENEQWLYAPNYIYASNYTLLKEEKDTYKYPIDGWNWYNEQPYKIDNMNSDIIFE